ncbi:MAG: DUF4397 domain-containing protein [Phycisphaerales bacterium JB039]
MTRAVSSALALLAAAGAAAAQDARVRAVHASPDAPAVDIAVDGAKAIFDLGFTQATDYLGLPAATYNFQVTPAGATMPVVIDADVPLAAGATYSIAAVNTLSAIEPLVLVDDNTIVPGQARVRFVHASPDAPAVDIALTGGGVVFADTAFKGASDYLTLAPGDYDLEVRLAGTSTVVLDLPTLSIGGDTVYTVWAMGFAAPGASPALDAIVTVDAIPAPGAAIALAGLGGLVATRRRRH